MKIPEVGKALWSKLLVEPVTMPYFEAYIAHDVRALFDLHIIEFVSSKSAWPAIDIVLSEQGKAFAESKIGQYDQVEDIPGYSEIPYGIRSRLSPEAKKVLVWIANGDLNSEAIYIERAMEMKFEGFGDAVKGLINDRLVNHPYAYDYSLNF